MPRVERRHQEHAEERRDAKVVPERRGQSHLLIVNEIRHAEAPADDRRLILRRATKARLRASSTRYWRPSRRMRRRLKARFRAPCHAPWPPFPKDAARRAIEWILAAPEIGARAFETSGKRPRLILRSKSYRPGEL